MEIRPQENPSDLLRQLRDVGHGAGVSVGERAWARPSVAHERTRDKLQRDAQPPLFGDLGLPNS